MNQPSTGISRREACRLLAKAGVANVLCSFSQRDLAQGSAPVSVTGKHVPALQGFDALLVEYLKRNKSITGASFTIARLGGTIYARGFGWADLETREAVQPDSLFRVASVSKTFTSAAIMLLFNVGSLSCRTQHFLCSISRCR